MKLSRAEEHFAHLKRVIGYPLGRHPYPVTEVLTSENEYEYRLYFPRLDPAVSLIVGDLLFDIRCGLDHLWNALTRGQDSRSVQFPIFTHDPFQLDTATGKHLRPWAYRAWMAQTEGIPEDTLAVATQLQPFYQARDAKSSPEHHALAILRTLQDNDKHRQLNFLGAVLKNTVLTIEGFDPVDIAPEYHHGALVCASPKKMDVQAEGEIAIPFGVGADEGYEYPSTFDMILTFVAHEVLPVLEPLSTP